jgi:sugar-specific transcriptional regulator TrmB
MDPKLLENIGLTEAETRVYLALVELGSTKTGTLSIKSKVSYSKIYKILYRLEQKGLVGHIVKGRIKYFKAMSPKSILEYIDEKSKDLEAQKEEIEKALPALEMLIPSDTTPESVTYNGFKAIKNLLLNMIEELKPDESYHVMGAMYEKDIFGARPFFRQFHLERANKKIYVKMLANSDTKGNLEPETFKLAEIRYLPKYLMTNMHIFFYNDTVILILWMKDPIAFYIKSKDAVESFQTYFDTFLKMSKE